jgi:hypothetical protein
MTGSTFNKFDYHKSMGAGLTDGEYRVLAVMWDYAKPDGTDIRPTHKAVADQCGMGMRTVRRHVASLLAKGWLHEDRPGRNVGRGGGAAKYRLTTPGTPANTGRCSASDSDGTPANPDQNTGQSVSEHRPIRVGTPANTGRLTDKEQIKRTDQVTKSFVSGRFVSKSPSASASTATEDGYECCECFQRFKGDPPQRHLKTRQPVCADCPPF